eukprot:CAMPEP_0119559046 /NCGR_PEP_ID=MMETSP1352-20130426/11777_1 /TAXON_ID=265584 /ORGANISM="Stauroneis constricta, Strain CCMP1120" /LENGTH=589 /DNA_ID=CAMNT_0007606601 /DNA_START=224 /DNA_END=1993 /DNA_ORIENTATION=-
MSMKHAQKPATVSSSGGAGLQAHQGSNARAAATAAAAGLHLPASAPALPSFSSSSSSSNPFDFSLTSLIGDGAIFRSSTGAVTGLQASFNNGNGNGNGNSGSIGGLPFWDDELENALTDPRDLLPPEPVSSAQSRPSGDNRQWCRPNTIQSAGPPRQQQQQQRRADDDDMSDIQMPFDDIDALSTSSAADQSISSDIFADDQDDVNDSRRRSNNNNNASMPPQTVMSAAPRAAAAASAQQHDDDDDSISINSEIFGAPLTFPARKKHRATFSAQHQNQPAPAPLPPATIAFPFNQQLVASSTGSALVFPSFAPSSSASSSTPSPAGLGGEGSIRQQQEQPFTTAANGSRKRPAPARRRAPAPVHVQSSNLPPSATHSAAAAAAITVTPDASSSSSDQPHSGEDADDSIRFREYQVKQWTRMYEELVVFHDLHGHCQVPNKYSANPTLAGWTKRQRYQYKNKRDGKPSTMTDERVTALEKLGFIWESQGLSWNDRFHDLIAYKSKHGHCNVPSTYPHNPKLATWTKHQRRHFKLLKLGRSSNMTPERISMLNRVGFIWVARKASHGSGSNCNDNNSSNNKKKQASAKRAV